MNFWRNLQYIFPKKEFLQKIIHFGSDRRPLLTQKTNKCDNQTNIKLKLQENVTIYTGWKVLRKRLLASMLQHNCTWHWIAQLLCNGTEQNFSTHNTSFVQRTFVRRTPFCTFTTLIQMRKRIKGCTERMISGLRFQVEGKSQTICRPALSGRQNREGVNVEMFSQRSQL